MYQIVVPSLLLAIMFFDVSQAEDFSYERTVTFDRTRDDVEAIIAVQIRRTEWYKKYAAESKLTDLKPTGTRYETTLKSGATQYMVGGTNVFEVRPAENGTEVVFQITVQVDLPYEYDHKGRPKQFINRLVHTIGKRQATQKMAGIVDRNVVIIRGRK